MERELFVCVKETPRDGENKVKERKRKVDEGEVQGTGEEMNMRGKWCYDVFFTSFDQVHHCLLKGLKWGCMRYLGVLHTVDHGWFTTSVEKHGREALL